MFCPFCGTTVSNDAVFCPECGANLRQERQIFNGEERPRPHIAEERENAVPSSRQTFTPAAEPAQAQDKKQGKKPPNKALIAILASVGVIVLLALFILVRQMSAPLNPTGIRTLDTYDNSYFDFSFDRQDGFAFASDEEIARIGNLVSDLELDDELDNGPNHIRQ